MKKKAVKARLPKLKKNIRDFLLSEEGKVTKKDVLKMGTSLIVTGILFAPSPAEAQHANYFFDTGRGGHHSHSSHGSHGSHSSY